MPYCINCGSELTDNEFEEYEGYCSKCIQYERKDYSYKSFKILWLFIFGLIILVITSIQVLTILILNIAKIFSIIQYIIPPSIILASSAILCTYCLKRLSQEEVR